MAEILKQAVFVDLASLDAMSSEHGAQVHHGSLLERLSQNRRLVRAVAYGTFDDDRVERFATPQYQELEDADLVTGDCSTCVWLEE